MLQKKDPLPTTSTKAGKNCKKKLCKVYESERKKPGVLGRREQHL
jgi:hypothetical protein